jgi:nicotinamide riboside transporter PnuC
LFPFTWPGLTHESETEGAAVKLVKVLSWTLMIVTVLVGSFAHPAVATTVDFEDHQDAIV